MAIRILLFTIIFSARCVFGQETFPVNGIYDERPGIFAFTNATIYIDFETKIEEGTLLISNGEIVAVGKDVKIPKGTVVEDCQGLIIYPSFIDLYTDYGMPKIKKEKKTGSKPQYESDKKGAYGWNEAIKSEQRAQEVFTLDQEKANEFRKLGFGTVLSHQQDGIARGSGVLVALGKENENEVILKEKASAHYSFDKGTSTQEYPGSLMGMIALLRQTYLDAAWYEQAKENADYNISLEAWNDLQSAQQIFTVKEVLSLLRADELGDEFNIQYTIKGSGDEYQKLKEVAATGAKLIIPVNFPNAYDVEDPFDALNVTLAEMKHWELAPKNPFFLNEQNIDFAFTTSDLEKKEEFLKNVRKAIDHGLSEKMALKSLTFNPAKMIGAEEKLGSIEKGKIASFIITSGNVFDKETRIIENWVQGEKFVIHEGDRRNIDGKYNLVVAESDYLLIIENSPFNTKARIQINDSSTTKVNLSKKNNQVSLSYKISSDSSAATVRLSGLVNGKLWQGRGQLATGEWIDWKATYVSDLDADTTSKEKGSKKVPEVGEILYPFSAYGNRVLPQQETVLLKNATVWTNEKEGVIENADVLIKGGKIAAVGSDLSSSNAKEVDASGKHITSGIIDEHSHIAISRGVNEWTQASSAEVRIGDVVNSEDVNIYRQLAGGVTIAQLLHGSANPIGGQSAIIKLRWGYLPEEMKFKAAAPFIKFALGENVKQSNWGDDVNTRYPQSRMGVEQIYIDYFTRAREYGKARAVYSSLSKKLKKEAVAPRRDLEMETILEVLNKKRFVTCHSYVQSEVNMLMKIAEEFNFRINTFTHILEGYKLADKLEAHGANASTFSDWWAYKYEVIDAIPYNAALLHQAGVNTAINSDDAEMGRRLNQEAAKVIKYGGLSEEEAWKMVTLNPAKMLHIADKVGSLKAGKDADVVVWSDHPLSIYAKVEMTYVDGICFYNLKSDRELREYIRQERARLIQKMLQEKNGGAPTQKPVPKKQKIYHCDDMEGDN